MSDFDVLAELLKAHREVAVIASLDLRPHDKAIVAGAYEGTTIKFLCDFFDMEVHGYEPQHVMRERAAQRLANYPKVHLHEYGIGVESGLMPMVRGGTDMCSFIADGTPADTVGMLRLADDIFEVMGRVQLMVLNMEKYEHVLLPYMADRNLMHNVEHLLVQFHGEEGEYAPSAALRRGLNRTHTLRWVRPRWQWAYWELDRVP